MFNNIQWGTFILFAGFIAFGIVFTYFLIPETANLSLEDMDVLFSTPGFASQKRRTLDGTRRQRSGEGQRWNENDDDIQFQDIKPSNSNSTHVETV